MIKRIILFLLTLLILCGFVSCNQDDANINESTDTKPKVEETELTPIEQNEFDYIVRIDWMTFHFSKKDFREADITDIVTEADSVMADVRNYLKANYTLEEAEETVCYFDSSYCNENGQKRSMCIWDEKIIYCISLDDFVHEYVHMVSENNLELVYHPNEIFSEGLAQYVSLNFYDGIASKEYNTFKAADVSKNSNAYEYKIICDLLSDNELVYNAENYNKAFLALLDKTFDVPNIDKNSDFYKYNIGYVFVDYCVNQLGGLEKFMSVYCDSVTIIDVYGKTVDELVIDSRGYNMLQFYKYKDN